MPSAFFAGDDTAWIESEGHDGLVVTLTVIDIRLDSDVRAPGRMDRTLFARVSDAGMAAVRDPVSGPWWLCWPGHRVGFAVANLSRVHPVDAIGTYEIHGRVIGPVEERSVMSRPGLTGSPRHRVSDGSAPARRVVAELSRDAREAPRRRIVFTRSDD